MFHLNSVLLDTTSMSPYIKKLTRFIYITDWTQNSADSVLSLANLNFELYLFYNNNTWLQIGHWVILLGWELIRNTFSQGKPLEFLPWMKNPNLLMPAMGFEPMSSQ